MSGEDTRDGAQQDFPIERQRPVVNVLHIHFHPSLEIDVVAAGDGPQAGEPGTHTEAAALPALVVVDLAWNGGARAHQGHVTAQHVPQLRPFVDGELAQVAAEEREARVARDLEDASSRVLRWATAACRASAFSHMERNL